jgi:hypothetical protein
MEPSPLMIPILGNISDSNDCVELIPSDCSFVYLETSTSRILIGSTIVLPLFLIKIHPSCTWHIGIHRVNYQVFFNTIRRWIYPLSELTIQTGELVLIPNSVNEWFGEYGYHAMHLDPISKNFFVAVCILDSSPF